MFYKGNSSILAIARQQIIKLELTCKKTLKPIIKQTQRYNFPLQIYTLFVMHMNFSNNSLIKFKKIIVDLSVVFFFRNKQFSVDSRKKNIDFLKFNR